ncbi:3D domain-containing protein [Lysinibacillus sp. FSL K6-0102]|uniref:3D domain-containing protein n=1 Tax=Lysinibacillus sp. FSL K6-0102 TaxID=2975290 RepID=UPI0030FA8ACC
MKKFNKSVTVPTIIVCTLGWGVFASKAIQENHKEESSNVHKYTSDEFEKRLAAYRFIPPYDNIKKEYERLKEEERKRLEELERQRLERLEKIRLVKIKEAKKIAEQKRIEELKKQQQEEVISRGDTNSTGNWMTFNASYYTAYCSEGCTGVTATGYDVSNTIYYNGLRIIATDPNVIKLGTIVEVKTPYETFKAISLDTGGAIKNRKVDILVSSTQEAINLGRHNIQIKVLKIPK